jgi:hypothetical protein
MLERNMALKEAPERWQNNTCVRSSTRPCHFDAMQFFTRAPHKNTLLCCASVDEFDVVVAFEERVFDQIIDGTRTRADARACACFRCQCPSLTPTHALSPAHARTDLQSRGGRGMRPVLVINLDVKDNAAEAAVAAPQALALCTQLAAAGDDWEGCLEGVLAEFEATHARRPLYSICYY